LSVVSTTDWMGWHWVGNQVLNHNCQRQGLLHLAIALPLLFGITAPNALAQSVDSADVVSADLSYDGALWGIAKGQSAPTATWQNQAQLDLGFRLTPVTSSTTWRAHASVRWRNTNPDRDPGTLIGSTPLFDPSDWGAGTGARLMQVGIGMESKSLNLLAGWIQPQQHFLLQPLSKKVLNHAVLSAKGLGGNIPFVSSFSTWGALADWRSSSKSYIKAGTFMTYPEATESSNHGLWFGGNPNQLVSHSENDNALAWLQSVLMSTTGQPSKPIHLSIKARNPVATCNGTNSSGATPRERGVKLTCSPS